MRNYRLYDEVLLKKQLNSGHTITTITEESGPFYRSVLVDYKLEVGTKATIIEIFSFYDAFRLRFLVDGRILYCNVDKKYLL